MSTVHPISGWHPLKLGDVVQVHSDGPLDGRQFTVLGGTSEDGYDLSDKQLLFVTKQEGEPPHFGYPWFSPHFDHWGLCAAYGGDGLLYVESHDEPLAGEYLERIEHTS
jgi:hypothetical protein